MLRVTISDLRSLFITLKNVPTMAAVGNIDSRLKVCTLLNNIVHYRYPTTLNASLEIIAT